MFLGPSDPGIIHAQIKGPDAEHVYQKGLQLQQKIASIPGVIDAWQDWENPTPQIRVKINNVKARHAGISTQDIFSALSMFYRGNSIGSLIEGDDEIPLVAIGQKGERRSIDTLKRVNVNPQGDPEIMLSQVASLVVESQYGAIQREDFSRTVTVEARPTLQSAEDLAPTVLPIFKQIEETLADGHSVEFDGIITDSAKGKAALAANVPMALGVVFLLLIAQFNGFIRPIIIVMTIPLLTAGAALGLFVTQSPFGFMVILGLLSLAGIIINNAIVLLDRIDIERSKQATLRDAILVAGQRRLRPILMTTITTILGLLPLIISKDPLFFGMASVIAFGLFVGTLLTLGVTPLLYETLLKNK
jgi:multidrug efflux pump subunit AcrB